MELDLKQYIASIDNWPKKGIIFRDITPLLNDPVAYNYAIDKIVEYAKSKGVTKIAGPEARGFMIGCPVAAKLGVGFVPVRKPGKLPRATISEEYQLEYGTNILCMHTDALSPDDKVLIVDDLLATGGTAVASAHLCENLGAKVVGFAFLIDLVAIGAKATVLKDYDVYSLMEFDGE